MLVRIISVSATLFLMLFLSHRLSVLEYGRFTSFWIQSLIAFNVAGIGLPIFVFTYNKEKLGQILTVLPKRFRWYFVLWAGAVSLVFSVVQLYTNQLFEVTWLHGAGLTVYALCYTYTLVLDALSIVYGYFKTLLVTSLLFNIIYIVLFVSFFGGYLSQGALLIALLGNILLKLLLLKVNKFKIEASGIRVSFESMKNHWLYTGLYDVSQNVIRNSDKFILSIFIGKEMLAQYNNLTYEIPVFALVFSSVKSSTSIYLASSFKDVPTTTRFLRTAGTLMGYFIFPSVLFIGFYANEVITLAFSEKYLIHTSLFLIALIKLPNYNFLFTSVLQYYEKGSVVHKGVWLDVIIALVLVYPLYLLMGYGGIVLSIALSTYCQNLYYANEARKLLQTRWKAILPMGTWLVQIVLFMLLIGGGHWLLGNVFNLQGFVHLIVAFTLTAPVVLWYIIRAYKEMRHF